MKYRCIVFSCPWQAGGRGPGALGMLGGVGTEFWACLVGLVSRVLGRLAGVGTKFWACSVGRYPEFWGCLLGSVLSMCEDLGMSLGIGTRHARGFGDVSWARYPECAEGAGEHHPAHRQLRGPRGGKSAFSFSPLLRREVRLLAGFSVSQLRPLMLLPAPMIMRKVELAPLLRCDGCLDNAPIMAAIAAAR